MTALQPEQFDLQRYLGTWYQFAATRNWYEPTGGFNTMAIYTQTPQGIITVLNTLINHGKVQSVDGVLTPTTIPLTFKIRLEKVIFGFPLITNYFIRNIIVDDMGSYKFTVVTTSTMPGHGSIYLLSRVQHPTCDEQTTLLDLVISLGYKVSDLRFTPQVCENQSLLLQPS